MPIPRLLNVLPFVNNQELSDSNPLPIYTPSGQGAPVEYRLQHAIDQILNDYGDTVLIKPKSLLKYGRNENVAQDTLTTVWTTGGNETYATGNTINRVSSAQGTDTQQVVIEGHTLSGSDLTFVTQTATLQGQNQVTLTTPLYRATRLYNNGSTNFAGNVYCYESGGTVTNGVPQDATKIHITVLAGVTNQSLKASTSLSSVDYWIITQFYASVNEKTSASVDFALQTREFGKVFRNRLPHAATSNGVSGALDLDPPIIVRPNSDIRITALASAASTSVDAWINGYLGLKQ